MSVQASCDNLGNRQEPIYKQLVASIREEIASGRLVAGARLPSMRDLARERGVSLGTIRHVYALLEREGLIESRRGRGTYVAMPERESDQTGRKEKALHVIDEAINKLSDLGFNTRESQIYFELRLRQKEDATRPIRIAVVAVTPEERSIIGQSLDNIGAARAYRLSYNDVISQPDRLDVGFDFVVAPAPLFKELNYLVPEHVMVMPVAITVSQDTVMACHRIPRGAHVGVLAVSAGFQDILRQECPSLLFGAGSVEFELFGNLGRTRSFVERQDVLLLSPNYKNLVETREASLLRREMIKDKVVIPCAFACDHGSLLYLNHAIEQRYRELREFMRA